MNDMELILPAVASLTGAVGGVVIGHWLSRRGAASAARRVRLENAFRAVVRARVLQKFPLGAGGAGAPPAFTKRDAEEFARTAYLKATERYFDALGDAREAVALLAADGVDARRWAYGKDFMEHDLEEIEHVLAGRLSK